MYQKIKKRFGLTLIELLTAILLFSAIALAATLMLTTGLKTWSSNQSSLDVRQNGNLAMEKMVRCLELASNITAATTDSITFAADIDNNGTNETVTIAFDAVNKRINITTEGITTILTPDAQSFSLSYYQSDTQTSYGAIPQPSFTPVDQYDRNRIATIKISLTMNKGSDTVTLSSSAFCRNRGVV